MLKVLIADDHPLYCVGLCDLVAALDDKTETVQATDFHDAVRKAREDGPFDLILSDLRMPGMEEFVGIRALREASPSVPIVVVTAFETRVNLERALEAGAQGFLPKTSPPSVMLNALRMVLRGEIYVPPTLFPRGTGPAESAVAGSSGLRSATADRAAVELLTERQLCVLALVGEGLSNRDIAERLDISEGTVKVHVGAILKTLGVSNRTQAALLATGLGITP